MQNIVSKIILIFLFLLFFLILTFYTFFSWEKKELNKPDFNISKIWVETLSWAISDKIDFHTTIYSKNKDYKIIKNNILLWTWVYLIDSRDIFSEKIINMWTNNIIINWGWLVYINNNPNKKLIVSFNNKIKIEFINKISGKKWAEMYLFPHMYFYFRPFRFLNLEQVDSLRISQLGTLSYFNNSFKNLDEFDFIKEKNKDFIKVVFERIIKNQKKYSKKLNEIKNKNIWNIVWEDFIEKYFSLFYNDRKKVIYYKNKTLNLLIKLLNNDDDKIISEIYKNIELIKELDLKEANTIKKIKKEIFYLVSYDLSDNSDLVQNRYNLLISKLFNINDSRKIKLIKDVDRYNFLWDFTNFLNLLILDIENKDLNLLEKEYYILFKQNILVSNFSNLELEQKYFDILLKWFISYSQNIEKYITDDNRESFIINVIYNKNLLEKIEKSFRYRYFKEDRNSQNLLILKENISIPNISWISIWITDIIEKYRKAEDNLKQDLFKFGHIIKSYEENIPKLKEYIDALSNYSLYKKEYSKINKILLWVEIYKDEEEKISRESFINYIKSFSWISVNNIDFEVKNNYYKINNISINWKNFSFDLFPYSWNLIRNIVYKNDWIYINNRQKWFYNFIESTSFVLNNEREKYEELFEKAKNEDKEKYDFQNFFVNTFFLSNDNKQEQFEIKENNDDDDEIIQNFKRSKLLWNRWEFRNISNILKINYSNLDVQRKTWKIFLIKIVDAKLNLKIKENNRNINYWALLNSHYKLEKNEHYFYNIKLEPFMKKDSSDKIELFPNIEFKLSWKIELTDFEKEIKTIFSKMPEINKKYLELSKIKKITTITYSIVTGKYYFK